MIGMFQRSVAQRFGRASGWIFAGPDLRAQDAAI
jgi:hypothetical protein